MTPETTTRVRRSTARHVNAQIYRQIKVNVSRIAANGVEAIILKLNDLKTITKEVVETARDCLVIGTN
jgi:hypothetical protein